MDKQQAEKLVGGYWVVCVEPGSVMVICPVHWQLQVESLVRSCLPCSDAAVEPGAHGAVTTGTHGCGVSTPCAAEVAAATCGFARVWHMPNGGMFDIGRKSITVATGLLLDVVAPGWSTSCDGEVP